MSFGSKENNEYDGPFGLNLMKLGSLSLFIRVLLAVRGPQTLSETEIPIIFKDFSLYPME